MVNKEPQRGSRSFSISMYIWLYVHKICQEVHTHTVTLESSGERNVWKEHKWTGTFHRIFSFDSCECATYFLAGPILALKSNFSIKLHKRM